jgi:hypothetical protein
MSHKALTNGLGRYLGGLFTDVTGVGVGHVTSFDGRDWDTMGGGVSLSLDCQALARYQSIQTNNQSDRHGMVLIGRELSCSIL